MGIVCSDYDGDGDSDVFVANDQTANFLYRNDGDGTFTDVALLSGVGYSGDGRPEASMGADFGDYDNDGLLDLVVPNFHREPTSLYRNEGGGLFSWESMRSGLGRPSLAFVGWGTAFLDYDNDGFVDIFVANGHTLDNADLFDASSSYPQPDQLFRNTGKGRFEDVSAATGEALAAAKVSRGAAFGDYDDDGDTDIFVVHSIGRADLLRNEEATPATGSRSGRWACAPTATAWGPHRGPVRGPAAGPGDPHRLRPLQPERPPGQLRPWSEGTSGPAGGAVARGRGGPGRGFARQPAGGRGGGRRAGRGSGGSAGGRGRRVKAAVTLRQGVHRA